MKMTIGTKIYYRGDMANREGFGEIVEIIESERFGQDVKIKFEDGRETIIKTRQIDTEDTGDGRTRFCTEWAYLKKRKQQMDEYKKWATEMIAR
jgi:hypothetical protein